MAVARAVQQPHDGETAQSRCTYCLRTSEIRENRCTHSVITVHTRCPHGHRTNLMSTAHTVHTSFTFGEHTFHPRSSHGDHTAGIRCRHGPHRVRTLDTVQPRYRHGTRCGHGHIRRTRSTVIRRTHRSSYGADTVLIRSTSGPHTVQTRSTHIAHTVTHTVRAHDSNRLPNMGQLCRFVLICVFECALLPV